MPPKHVPSVSVIVAFILYVIPTDLALAHSASLYIPRITPRCDVVRVTMSVQGDTSQGKVFLTSSETGGILHLWLNADKTGSLPVGGWAPNALPTEVWAEGFTRSSAEDDVTLTLTWKDDSGGTFTDATRNTTVVEVTAIAWATYGDNTALDNDSNGKRIYPCKKSSTDAAASQRRKVNVNATVSPTTSLAVNVYFGVWDVDDPSSSTAPIDTNDTTGPTGGDNKGTASFVPEDYAQTVSGVATGELTVSMFPGDNYKIVASASAGQIVSMTQALADGADAGLPTAVIRTDMLTVWRKLHVECDSMGAEFDTGNSTALEALKLTDSNKTWVANQFHSYGEDWKLKPKAANNTWCNVALNAATSITVVMGNDLTTLAQVGDAYRVEFKGFPSACLLRGDIPQPDTGAFADAFAKAFVTPVYDTGLNDESTPWHFNFGGNPNGYTQLWSYCGTYHGAVSSANYWVAYIMGSYSCPDESIDNNPAIEGGNIAAALPGFVNERYASGFEEVVRSVGAQHSWTDAQKAHARQFSMVHEVGHLFGLADYQDEDNQVMWCPSSDATENHLAEAPMQFRDADVDAIRKTPDMMRQCP